MEFINTLLVDMRITMEKRYLKTHIKLYSLCYVLIILQIQSCNHTGYTDPWCPLDENCILYFSPSYLSFTDKDFQNLDVKIHNGNNILSVYFDIMYNPSLLSIDELSLYSGSKSFFTPEDSVTIEKSDFHINDSLGIIHIGLLGRKENFQGSTGDGSLVKLRLGKKSSRISTRMQFENVEIYTWPLNDIPVPSPYVTLIEAWIDL